MTKYRDVFCKNYICLFLKVTIIKISFTKFLKIIKIQRSGVASIDKWGVGCVIFMFINRKNNLLKKKINNAEDEYMNIAPHLRHCCNVILEQIILALFVFECLVSYLKNSVYLYVTSFTHTC